MGWWSLVSFACAAYVFVGIGVVFLVVPLGWLAILLAIVAWIGNWFLLRYANRKW